MSIGKSCSVCIVTTMMMLIVATAKVSDVHITDANGLPVTRGRTVPRDSRLVCSTPYDSRYNFTYSWTDVRRSRVVAGNTLILRNTGFFVYRCTVEHVVLYVLHRYELSVILKKRCYTSRTVTIYVNGRHKA